MGCGALDTWNENADFAWRSLENVQELISLADNKAGALIAGWVLLIGWLANFLARALPRILAAPPTGMLTRVLVGSVVVCVVLAVALILCVGLVFYPRHSPRQARPGFIFWEDILKHDGPAALCRSLAAHEREARLENLTEQLYECAAILHRKMYWLKVSFQLAIPMILAWLVSIAVCVTYLR
jgi:hypothetical protein